MKSPSASTYFHRAQAYLLDKNRAAAMESLRAAKELNLERSSLHPLEHLAYEKVGAELEPK